MHAEWGRIDADDRRAAQRRAGVGRPADRGRDDVACACSKARRTTTGTIHPFEGDTAIFITPGYRFKAVDGLITNFHLPRSTLFMLVSALMGLDVMKAAYAHAIAGGIPLLLLRRREPAAASDREIAPQQPAGQAERDHDQQRPDQPRAEADRAVRAEPAAEHRARRHAQAEQPQHLPAEREEEDARDVAGEVEQLGDRGGAGQAVAAQRDEAGREEGARARAEEAVVEADEPADRRIAALAEPLVGVLVGHARTDEHVDGDRDEQQRDDQAEHDGIDRSARGGRPRSRR